MALTFSIGSVIAAAYGWHVAFFVAGVPGIILACLIFFTVREPIRGRYDARVPAEGQERYRFGEAVSTLISIRPLLYLLIAAVCVVIAHAGMSASFPPFTIRLPELSLAEETGRASCRDRVGPYV